ncbi:hypothetical protein SpCBS45565_g00236 [Spizellomyces sp. 'palustris']|nr:hypothetical protein SpCBS45565_g00236 [Spizellomyces sp. 'palustris']
MVELAEKMEVDTPETTQSGTPKGVDALSSASDIPDIVDDGAIIAENSWAIVQMPSDNTKLVQFKANSVVNLGKFGSFNAKDLFGYPFDIPYEVHGDKQVRPASMDIYALDAFDLETEEGTTNKDLVDRREAQKLSQVEIEQMKADSLKGQVPVENLIKTIVENSETFDRKTEFSKAKYIKRKQKKFSKVFTPRRPSARGLCEHFFKDNPRRICELRVDTLSQILTTGNVRSGARYLIVDEAGGLLTCALVERMQGRGEILQLHDHETYNVDLIKHLNLPPSIPNILKNLPWTRLTPNEDEDMENMSIRITDETRLDRLRHRILTTRAKRALLYAGGFDGLFIISQYDVKEIIETLSPYLAGSRPVVVYSPYKETMLESFLHLRNSRDFVNAQLTESWIREYQVPTAASGTHPLMRMSGSGGYILSAIRVIDCETHAATARRVRVKNGKVEEAKSTGEGGVEHT